MIQLKQPYTHSDSGISKTGTLLLEIASWEVMKDAIVYNIEDFIQDENGAKQAIGKLTKRVENQEFENYAQVIDLDFETEGLSNIERRWKYAQEMLMLITKYNLVDSEHTRYNALPDDWEFTTV
jgi:hypothetical protein